MNEQLQQVLRQIDAAELANVTPLDGETIKSIVVAASDDEVDWLLQELAQWQPPEDSSPQRALSLNALSHTLYALAGRQAGQRAQSTSSRALNAEHIINLYKHLGNEVAASCYLLAIVTHQAGVDDLQRFADIMVTNPPADANSVAVAFSPLFQSADYDPRALFPQLLDGLQHVTVAVSTMDLANFLTRERRVAEHPAKERVQMLNTLLEGMTAELDQLESLPDQELTVEKIAQKVGDCVSLAVSLCDALALIGDPSSIGKLRQVMQLSHRRLRAEAAAALARAGDEEGKTTLVALAADPVTRLRCIAYADELGFADEIKDKFRQPNALAEAELSLFLAQPAQVGIPPATVEVVDERQLYWPGYDEPLACFLVRFTYSMGEKSFSNIGIVGPVTHVVSADLQSLSDDDVYACFAGWQAEHEEIYEIDVTQLSAPQRVEWERLERRARDQGFSNIHGKIYGRFFGDRVLVAQATQDEVSGFLAADELEVLWYPRVDSLRPIGPREIYDIYKGKRLLRTFNE